MSITINITALVLDLVLFVLWCVAPKARDFILGGFYSLAVTWLLFALFVTHR